jgi:hypothetical protein
MPEEIVPCDPPDAAPRKHRLLLPSCLLVGGKIITKEIAAG